MNEIVAIVEGQSESAFVERLLQPHFWQWNVHLRPTLPGRIHRRGGVRPWQGIRGDILRTLKERRDRICTTMFDFYAMPKDWPGRAEAARHPWSERGRIVETAIHADIAQAAGPDFIPTRFIPYVQIHEFEALLFTDVGILAETVSTHAPDQAKRLAQELQAILAPCSSPEEINDGPETAPSRRISKLAPGYHKVLHGPRIIERIGLHRIRITCEHFGQWIGQLETAARQGTC